MKLLVLISGGRLYTKEIHEKVSYDLFFNSILSISIEGLIEFILFGYLNVMTAELNMSGEILGFALGTFSLSMSGVILPLAIILLIIFTKNK